MTTSTKVCTASRKSAKRTSMMLKKNAYKRSQMDRKFGMLKVDESKARREQAMKGEAVLKLVGEKRYQMKKIQDKFNAELKTARKAKKAAQAKLRKVSRDYTAAAKADDRIRSAIRKQEKMLAVQEAKARAKCSGVRRKRRTKKKTAAKKK